MRADIFRQAAQTPELVFSHYAKHKREYLQTAKSCEEAGFRFVPVILEAHGGGWGSMARGVLDWVSRQVAAVQQEEVHVVSLRIAQRISCTLHRENARGSEALHCGGPLRPATPQWLGGSFGRRVAVSLRRPWVS
jgi:hypothetical protein